MISTLLKHKEITVTNAKDILYISYFYGATKNRLTVYYFSNIEEGERDVWFDPHTKKAIESQARYYGLSNLYYN